MKHLIAALTAVGLCASAFAQTTCGTYTSPCPQPTFNPNAYQVSTAGNGGRLTWNLGQGLDGTYSQVAPPNLCGTQPTAGCTTFNPIMQDFSGVIQADLTGYYTSDADAAAAGGGWVVTAMTWALYGTNGPGCCGSVDKVVVSQASIVPAMPLLDAFDNAVTGKGYDANSPLTTIDLWTQADGTALLADGTPAVFSKSGNAQTMSGVLRSGKYLVSFTAAGCTGRGCNIKTYRYFFSVISITSHYMPAAAPPPCTDCGDRNN